MGRLLHAVAHCTQSLHESRILFCIDKSFWNYAVEW